MARRFPKRRKLRAKQHKEFRRRQPKPQLVDETRSETRKQDSIDSSIDEVERDVTGDPSVSEAFAAGIALGRTGVQMDTETMLEFLSQFEASFINHKYTKLIAFMRQCQRVRDEL